MAYCSASDVAAHCIHILDGRDMFDEDHTPNITQVVGWMSSGCALIEGRLSQGGYGVPPASSTALYRRLNHLNAIWAAAWADFSRHTGNIGPRERTRAQILWEQFDMFMEQLLDEDLTLQGLSRQSAAIYIGGISRSEKQSIESDPDAVDPRFYRGQHRFEGTIEDGPSTAS